MEDEIFDAFVVRADGRTDGLQVTARAILGGLEDQRLGLLDDAFDSLLFVQGHAADRLGGCQQAAAQRRALDDAGRRLRRAPKWACCL